MTSTQSTTTSANDSPPKWTDEALKFFKGRGKIQQWVEMSAAEDLRARAAENRRNSEAESAFVRRNVWDETGEKSEAEDMGNTVLGDITHPAHIVMPQQSSGVSPIAVAALVLASATPLAGAGAAIGYFLANKTQQQAPEFSDETVTIGLGRIEDYLRSNEGQP